jgi:hypothetical protein
MAKLAAYFLAPGLILSAALSGVVGGWLSIDFEKPITISELKSEIPAGGEPTEKRGIVLIAEPASKDFRVQLKHVSKIWSSLDSETARSNNDRLSLSGEELKVITPFVGVNEPVALVVDGELGKDIQVPGGTESVEDWRLSSRRSNSLVSGVLAVCFLMLGMAVPIGTAPVDRDQNNAGQIGTEPDKD